MEYRLETIGSNTFVTYYVDEAELDSFALKMLEHNEIEGIPPFSCIQENSRKKLRYAVTSYETLASYIGRQLPVNRIWNVLESIGRNALELEEYMLSPGGLILDTEKMYTEVHTGKTYMIYLPVKNGNEMDVFGFLKNLIGRLQYESPESAVSILKISNDINSGKINGLRQLISAVREAKDTGTAFRTDLKGITDVPVRTEKENAGAGERKWEKKTGGAMEKEKPEGAAGRDRTVSQEKPSQKETSPVRDGEQKKSGTKKAFPLFGGEKKKTKEAGAASPAFAVPGMESSPIPTVPDVSVPEEDEKQGEKKGFWNFRKKEKAAKKGTAKGNIQKTDDVDGRESQKKEEYIPSPARDAAKWDFGETILTQPDDCMTIVDDMGGGSESPYLLRRENNQRMYLEKESIRIGRDSSYVDFYIGNNMKIGRSHAEIIREGQDFYIRDNHSKNHTYVNGKIVQGDTRVKLQDGDSIYLADEEFEYHER